MRGESPGPGLGLGPGGVSVNRAAVQLAGVPSGRSPERSCLPGLGGVSERGQGSDGCRVAQTTPTRAAGAGAVNTDPRPQRHRRMRKGGPLWLQVPGYVLPATLCQDQRRVSPTAVLVTTRTGFPPQVRPG